ncbi:MAG: hypothetical protein GY864_01995 [Desulfobacterales bacterium]|nr:hypothetical protein [Desulfobacterales bacterium]
MESKLKICLFVMGFLVLSLTLTQGVALADETGCTGLECFFGTGGSDEITDNQAPTIQITNPDSGNTAYGVVSITATASDNVGVSSVQFLIDGSVYQSADTSEPYSVTWTTIDFNDGNHTITAVAGDAAGNSTTSTAVTVTVTNTSSLNQVFPARVFPVSDINIVYGSSNMIIITPTLNFSSGLAGAYYCYAAYLKDGDIYLAEQDLSGETVFRRFLVGDSVKNFMLKVFSGETSWTPNVFSSLPYADLNIVRTHGVLFLLAVVPVSGGSMEGAIFTFQE